MDLCHSLGALVEEEPGQLLHQLRVPAHPVQRPWQGPTAGGADRRLGRLLEPQGGRRLRPRAPLAFQNASRKSRGHSGFATYESMPLARRRSRSPFMAWAVVAMIGVWTPVVDSRARIAAIASKPSISGICTSIQDGVERLLPVQGRQRLASVAGHDDLMPPLLQYADRQPLIDRVVLGQQEPQRARLPTGRGLIRPGGMALEAQGRPQRGHDPVQEGRLPDRFGQVAGHV